MSCIQHSVTRLLYISCMLLFAAGCSKFIEVGPPKTETIVGATVYTNDKEATGAMVGIYGQMISSTGFAGGYNRSVTYLAALSADELITYSRLTMQLQFYENSVSSNKTLVESALWNEMYRYIYYANAVREGVQNPEITGPTRQQLQAEALFVRAFCHFYLVNLFGDVPLITTTDYKLNKDAPRTSRSVVYRQIIEDLRTAQAGLSDSYIGEKRVRPNKAAATALLARVYLYRGDWAKAEAQASVVIRDPLYLLDTSLNHVFLGNNREAIWQLMPNTPLLNTWEGSNFILTTAPSTSDVNAAALGPQLLAAFEEGDQRRVNWVDSVMVDTMVYYFPYKYKIKRTNGDLLEYSMVLRLAEQYLIRAEARVHLGKYAGARDDLNIIRTRAGLPGLTVNTAAGLLAAIEHERQVELFTEWGHRWLDLKRTNRADDVLRNLKAPAWQQTDKLYPLPQNEMLKNPGLKPQNPGYE